MKKIIIIILVFILNYSLVLSMPRGEYNDLIRDLKNENNQTTNIIRVKTEAYNNTFTCNQVAGILRNGFKSDPSGRIAALKLLSPKIEDIRNKQVIIDVFSEASDSIGKVTAIKLLSRIQNER